MASVRPPSLLWTALILPFPTHFPILTSFPLCFCLCLPSSLKLILSRFLSAVPFVYFILFPFSRAYVYIYGYVATLALRPSSLLFLSGRLPSLLPQFPSLPASPPPTAQASARHDAPVAVDLYDCVGLGAGGSGAAAGLLHPYTSRGKVTPPPGLPTLFLPSPGL